MPATETPTPTPAATPTLTPTATPAAIPETGGRDGFRAFAALIDAALAASDGGFFADRGVEIEITCTGDAVEDRGACPVQPAGTVLRGIPTDTGILELRPPDQYAGTLRGWFASARPDLSDEYGSGVPILYALAHRPAEGDSDEAYQGILTEIFTSRGVALRHARILNFQFLNGGWRLTGEIIAANPETVADWLSGECDFCYNYWERWEGAR